MNSDDQPTTTSAAAFSATSDQQGSSTSTSTSTSSRKKRPHPNASPPASASTPTSSSPRPASSEASSRNNDASATTAAATLVVQTPHTLRLLRLAVSGTAEHSRRARTLLSDLAHRSSPDVLWDLLGRLVVGSSSSQNSGRVDIRSGLYSSKWSERENAAATMGTIAANLPGVDRRGFLSDSHEDDACSNGGENIGLWLQVNDLLDSADDNSGDGFNAGDAGDDACHNYTHSKDNKLDTILEQGRLLLSSSEDVYSTKNQDEEDDEQALRDLDESAVSGSGERGKDAQSFLKRRVRLQRQILARRLGLGGILSAPIMTGRGDDQPQSNMLEDMVDDADLLPSNAPSGCRDEDACDNANAPQDGGGTDAAALARRKNMERRGRKRRRRSADDESGYNGEESEVTLRALLVLEMRRSGGKIGKNASSSARSHRNPQTLLATDLLYRTFDADWTVRHGALMAILALMKSWIVSLSNGMGNSKSDQLQCFGSWPHDILTRCLCILALDRFGDYSGSTLEKAATGTGGDRVVAPVREAAAQLLSLLLSIAPVAVQSSCFHVLRRLVRHEDDWEVRHGAMLAFKYIVTLRSGMTASIDLELASGTLACSCWDDVASLAVMGLCDESDDVRGASAQVLGCYIRNEGDENRESPSESRDIVEEFACPLWSALLQVGPVSSCAVDILALFALVMRNNCDLALQTVHVQSKRANGSAMQEVSLGSVIEKLIEFLRFDDEAVWASSLRVVGMIIKPIITRSISHAEIDGEESLVSVTRAFCDLLNCMFTAYFDLGVTGEDSTERESRSNTASAKDDAWSKVIGAIPPLLGYDKCRAMLFQMLSSVILRFVGIEKVGGATGTPPRRVAGSLESLDERQALLFECQRGAAKALALLVVQFGLISSEEDDTSVAGVLFLNSLLQALGNSPWSSMCESACVLFAALGEAHSSEDGPTTSAMVKSRGLFTSMLVDGPQCLSMADQASTFLRDPSVIGASDQILISMVEDHASALATTNGVESDNRVSADEVLKIWQGIICAKGAVLNSNGSSAKPSVTTTSMRLSSSIAGAAISWGVRDLPIKLTPIIRPLMTSLKNEESSNRLDWTCCYLARLLSLRSSAVLSLGVPTNVRDKVLANVCSVALANASSDSPSLASAPAGKNILQRIARDLDGDIDCVAPFGLILSPLKQDDVGNESESALLQGLGLLALLSQSLHIESQSYGQIIKEMLQVVVNYACTEPSSCIRGQAVCVVCTVCKSGPPRALQKAIPALLDHLKCLGDDHVRLHACRLLHAILDAAGTTICPFVRCLLPTAMSLMTDPSEECASLAASAFAALVRVSPLVERCQDANPTNAAPSGSEQSSNKVIDHLIHGEPLPPLRLPSAVQACMDKSHTTLRGYQKEGISWLHFLQTVNLNGALCDDMGVGKSLQALIGIALAHSDSVVGNDGAVKSLVVCPSTVVGHWINEVRKYFPDEHIFKPLMYTGPAKSRKAMLQEQLEECNLVVTSYSVLRNDIDALSSFPWVYCVLDEGHLLKNPRSATAKASRLIKARHKLILSGTPVQNHVNELWAVFDFLMPNFLGTEAAFTKSFAKPIINGQASGASPSAIGTSINKLKLLHQTVLPFILRREKQDVMKELPPKVISDIPCVLSSTQATMYQQFIESSEAKHALAALQRSMEAAYQDGGGLANGGVNIDKEQSIGKDVLKSLLYLRLLCTHPVLVVKQSTADDDEEAEDTTEQLSRLDGSGKLMALKDLLQSASICSDGLTAADNDQSTLYARRVVPDETDLSRGDLTQSAEDLGDDLNGEEGSSAIVDTSRDQRMSKCLIFAQFTQSLDIVEEYLFAPHMPSLRYLRIDGQVPLEERTKRVDRFNSDESIQVMLLTTRVGGLGLNLTGADTVIFLESDWNPFSDLQAMDRAHRIGQTKTVNVYRLICSNTIEEKIMRLQSIKIEMSKAIVNSDNSTMYSMGTDRLLDLFTFEDRQNSTGSVSVGRDAAGASVTGAHLLDAVSSQEDEYLSLSTESFLRDLLPQKGQKSSQRGN